MAAANLVFYSGFEGADVFLYGVRVPALGSATALTGSRALAWHELALNQTAGEAPQTTGVVWSEGSVTLLAEGHFSVEVTRGPPLAVHVRSVRRLETAELVHPVMAFVGAVVAHWTGRLNFHAAAVVLHGRAWLLMAPPGGGKSTLATCLRRRGHAVLCDDLAVLDSRTVFAGPRSADLREESAAHLDEGRRQQATTGRERWRAELGAAPYEVPLGGLIALEWGDRVQMGPAGVTERLRLLAEFDGLQRGPGTPTAFLGLLDVPTYVLRRPRSWEALDVTLSSIEAVAGALP